MRECDERRLRGGPPREDARTERRVARHDAAVMDRQGGSRSGALSSHARKRGKALTVAERPMNLASAVAVTAGISGRTGTGTGRAVTQCDQFLQASAATLYA